MTLFCFLFQLIFAQILSAVYALIMVAVVVALMMQIQEDGFLAPSSLFLFGVASSFVIAAILHPLEFGCLPHGLVYYITIPSMYLILIIYSLMNLHVVSWGTRETPADTTDAEKVFLTLHCFSSTQPYSIRIYSNGENSRTLGCSRTRQSRSGKEVWDFRISNLKIGGRHRRFL
jgi:hypothetical protein